MKPNVLFNASPEMWDSKAWAPKLEARHNIGAEKTKQVERTKHRRSRWRSHSQEQHGWRFYSIVQGSGLRWLETGTDALDLALRRSVSRITKHKIDIQTYSTTTDPYPGRLAWMGFMLWVWIGLAVYALTKYQHLSRILALTWKRGINIHFAAKLWIGNAFSVS
jgi:hypothetical protein